MGKALGIISLIFGLIGLLGGWLLGLFIPFGAYIFPAVAIVTGIIGIIVQESKGMAIAGLILGAITIIFVWFVLPFILVFIFLGLGGLGGLL